MSSKLKQIALYILISLISVIGYGYITFFLIYRDLAGGSMLYSYLWNIGFIIAFLLIDALIYMKMQSKEFAITKKNYFFARWTFIESSISFKTTIYLFYIFILIGSRVAVLDPTLVSAEFRNFMLSIEYGLVLVIAFDKLIESFLKDHKRMQKISAKFATYKNNKE